MCEAMYLLQWPQWSWMMNGKKSGERRGKRGARYMCAFRFSFTWNIKACLSTKSEILTSKGRKIDLKLDELVWFAVKVNKSEPAAAVCWFSFVLLLWVTSAHSNNIYTHWVILAGSFRLLSECANRWGIIIMLPFCLCLPQRQTAKIKIFITRANNCS